MAQFALADELGDFLGRTLEGGEVAQADLLLQLASAAIQSEAHQTLEFVEDDEVVLRGGYPGLLWLPERPVIDVSDITIRNGVGLPQALAITSTQYAWNRKGLLHRGLWRGLENDASTWAGWGGPYAIVEVTYSHGYEVIPDDIKGVCLSIASRMLSVPVGAGAITSEVTDGYSVTYAADRSTSAVTLTDDETRVARRYRPVWP